MEQQLDKVGLKNLNPMFYWRNVLDGGGKLMPNVLAVCTTIDEQVQIYENLANKYRANFIIESSAEYSVGTLRSNCVLRPRNLYVGEERDRMWKKIDILYFQGNEPMEILPAMLSGVTVVKEIAEIENVLNQPIEPLTRINNFEKGKEFLETLLRLC